VAKAISEGKGQYYQYFPRIPVIVTSQAKGKSNAMAAASHMRISRSPHLYGVCIAAEHFTYPIITDSKEFGVNFLPLAAAETVAAVGGSGGRYIDKFDRFNIAWYKPTKTAVPILEAAYAAYECKLVDERNYGSHNLLVGEVVAAHLLEEAFTAEGVLDLTRVSPALFLGIDYYVSPDKNSLRYLDRKVHGRC